MLELGSLAHWAGVAFAIVSSIISIFAARNKAAAEKVANLERRVDSAEDRITKVESLLQHLPDKDVTHRLELSMAEMKTELSVLAERIKPVSAISERLQEAMLERASR